MKKEQTTDTDINIDEGLTPEALAELSDGKGDDDHE